MNQLSSVEYTIVNSWEKTLIKVSLNVCIDYTYINRKSIKKMKKLFHLCMKTDNSKNIRSWWSTFRFFLSTFRRMTLMICVYNSIDLTMILLNLWWFQQVDLLLLKSVYYASILIMATNLVSTNEFFFLYFVISEKKFTCIIDDIHRDKSTQ